MILDLPFPPSVNHYWRHLGTKVLISAEGRAYRQKVAVSVRMQGGQSPPGFPVERLSVSILAYPPDKRRRDLDNLLKAACDSLTSARIWTDDEQIDQLSIRREAVRFNGQITVHINALT